VARGLNRRCGRDNEAVAPKLEEAVVVVRFTARRRRRGRCWSKRGVARHDRSGEAKEGSR
jgi:hypothetical protein